MSKYDCYCLLLSTFRTVSVIMVLIFSYAVTFSAGSGYLSVDFIRSLYPPNNPAEVVKGVLFYAGTGKVYVEVTSPVLQHITLTGKEMIVYYPKDRIAFIFQSNNPLTLPFASAFMGSVRENLGMPELGFTLSDVDNRGDSILSTWAPPPVLKQVLGKIILTEVNGVVVRSESFSVKGALSTRALYKSHASISQGKVPMEIYGGWQTSAGWTRENILFSNPKNLNSLPTYLNNFTIPPDVKPRRVQW